MKPELTPWWDALQLRDEVTQGSGAIDDLQMSLFKAVHGSGGKLSRYHDPAYYGEITYPSPNLIDLLAQVMVRIGSGERYLAAPALWRLEQAMGGGKSHGLIGLWHMATHPQAMKNTDIGREVFATASRIAGMALADDLGCPRVVVLCCDNMTAGMGDSTLDGPAQNLYERFLYRLFRDENGGFDKAHYKRFQPHYADKSKIAEALVAAGRPVLILIDEILSYIHQLQDSRHQDLATRDMAFLRALLDVVKDIPHVAMVMVMINSEKDQVSFDERGQPMRNELESLLIRNAKTATVTSPTDFAAILRRRLFTKMATADLINTTANHFQKAMKGPWSQKVFGGLARSAGLDFTQEVARCYPFHPALLALAEQEWSLMAGFQKVRSTIRIFAAATYALAQRGKQGEWAPLLIGPGDLPLSVSHVREAIISSGLITDSRLQNNYRQLAAIDIVNDDDKTGAARSLDRSRDADLFAANPRAAERAATALFLYSVVGPRGPGRQGATEAELKAATFVPTAQFGLSEAESVLMELQDPDRGLSAIERIEGRGNQPARLFLSTKQTVNMLFREARNTVSEEERDDEFAKVAEKLITQGPFKEKRFISAKTKADDKEPPSLREILSRADIDIPRSTRLLVLDARRFSLLNGSDRETREAMRTALGLGENKLPVLWASSCIFAVVNTRRRATARGAVTTYVAWKRVCEIHLVKNDIGLAEGARRERDEAEKQMKNAVRLAYQHFVYLVQTEEQQAQEQSPQAQEQSPQAQEQSPQAQEQPQSKRYRRVEREDRFEQENQSALDGDLVWGKLAEENKAFRKGAFDSRALLHNLADDDYGRPLDELRNLFWNAPRLPLLPDGDEDLKNAIFQAIQDGQMRLVSGDGTEQAVTTAASIGVGSSALRLAKPTPKEKPIAVIHCPPSGDWGIRQALYRRTIDSKSGPIDIEQQSDIAEAADQAEAQTEVQLSVTINTSLADEKRKHAVFKLLDGLGVQIDNASHIQMTVMVSLPAAGASTLEELAKQAGGAPSITEL